MNLRALVELTALISAHSPNLIESGAQLPVDAVERYWSCSRAQGRLWLARLTDFPAEMAIASESRKTVLRQRMAHLLADLFAGDLRARVWGAVLTARDAMTGGDAGAPIARSIVLQRESLRHRALRLLLDATNFSIDEFVRIDRLRRRMERWTDVLVGHLVKRYGVSEFAIDAERAREFGRDQLEDSWETHSAQVWDMYLVCLRTALPETALPGGRLALLRTEIARSMLSAFPREAFLESGLLKSVRLQRLLSTNPRSEMRPRGSNATRNGGNRWN